MKLIIATGAYAATRTPAFTGSVVSLPPFFVQYRSDVSRAQCPSNFNYRQTPAVIQITILPIFYRLCEPV